MLRLTVLVAILALAPLAAADGNSRYQVVHGWPQLPDGFAFGQVSGVDVDSHNHVFVFHRGDRPILCFEGATGKIVTSWGDGLFTNAHGLTVDAQDNIWVTDNRQHQVFKFTHEGKLLLTLGTKGAAGLDSAHFNGPTDVAIARSGEVYVSDGYGNNRVAKFARDGKFLKDWGTKGEQPGQFNLPHGISVDAQNRVYVADRANNRIQVFDSQGKFLAQWKGPEYGRPWGLSVGRDGFLYVADGGDLLPKPPDRGRAVKLDLTGKIVDKWGAFGSYDGQFYWAHDIGVGPDGAVYVVDVHLGMRAQKFVRR